MMKLQKASGTGQVSKNLVKVLEDKISISTLYKHKEESNKNILMYINGFSIDLEDGKPRVICTNARNQEIWTIKPEEFIKEFEKL